MILCFARYRLLFTYYVCNLFIVAESTELTESNLKPVVVVIGVTLGTAVLLTLGIAAYVYRRLSIENFDRHT